MYDKPVQEPDPPEIMAEGRYLRLVRRGRWEYAERPNAAGAVAVIATTDADELVLVEQHRVPLGRACLELPAGLAGDLDDAPGETFAQAARRELLEETGFSAARIEHLYTVATSPGLTSERIDLYRARGLSREHAGGGTDHEQITTHLVPIAGLDAWLARRADEGLVIDVKVYAAAALVRSESASR